MKKHIPTTHLKDLVKTLSSLRLIWWWKRSKLYTTNHNLFEISSACMIENQSTPQNFPFQQFPERACNFCFSTIKFKSTTWEKDVVIGPWQHRTRTFNSFENYFQLIYYKLDHSSLTTWGDFKHKLVRLETDPGKWISPKKKVMQPLLSGEITKLFWICRDQI